MKKQCAENPPDEEVTVKYSLCNRCKCTIRAGVKHMLEAHLSDFQEEADKYKLVVKEMSLLEWRKNLQPWCECKSRADKLGKKFGI
jgi:hypothetical protein